MLANRRISKSNEYNGGKYFAMAADFLRVFESYVEDQSAFSVPPFVEVSTVWDSYTRNFHRQI